MTAILWIIAIISFLSGVAGLAGAQNAIHQIIGGISLIIATVAVAGAGICGRLGRLIEIEEARNRAAEGGDQPSFDEQLKTPPPPLEPERIYMDVDIIDEGAAVAYKRNGKYFKAGDKPREIRIARLRIYQDGLTLGEAQWHMQERVKARPTP